MAKVTLSTIANLDNPTTAVSQINANFVAIAAAIEKQLSRDGTSPNSMSANLDTNGYRVINLPAPTANADAARHGDIQTYVTQAQAAQAAAETAQTAAELAETNAEASEVAAAASESTINAKWLGTDTSDPVNDDNGDPVSAGAFYYNTGTEVFRAYTGSAWVSVPSATLAGLTDTDVSGVVNGQGLAYNSSTEKYEPIDLVPASYIELIVACSDETTELAASTGLVTFRVPRAITVTAIRASLTTASTSGAVTVDVNNGGVSVFSTLLTIDQDEKTSTTAATAAVISDTGWDDDDEITIDLDGAGTGAAGLKVTIIGYRVLS